MDFTAFSDDDFDAKAWVNKALKSSAVAEGETLDTHASKLVMRLQTFIQKINSELEETSAQVVKDLPGIVRSIDVLVQEVASLKDRMGLVKQDIETVDKNTAQSMSLLVELDMLKERMVATSAALQEADNWTTLSSDIESAFDSEDMKKISSTLLGMQRSLMVLSDVPDYEQRKKKLASLENRLESMLSPRLVEAFNRHDVEATKECLVVFGDINRRAQVQSYYYRCHKAPLAKLWTTLVESKQPVVKWLPEYYNNLQRAWNTEFPFCGQLFPDAEHMMANLLSNALSGRQPLLQEVISEHLQSSEVSSGMDQIIVLFKQTEAFARSLGCRDKTLLNALFDTFVHYQLEFGPMLSEQLLRSLKTSELSAAVVAGGDFDAVLSSSKSTLPFVVSLANASLVRCVDLTGMLSVDGLANAVDDLFSGFCDNLRAAITTMRKKYDTQGMSDKDEENIEENWRRFQASFELVQLCGETVRSVQDYEQELRHKILSAKSALLHHAAESNAASPNADGSISSTSSAASLSVVYDFMHDRPKARAALEGRVVRTEQGQGLFEHTMEQISLLSSEAHMFAFDVVTAPMDVRLRRIHELECWKASVVHDFEVSPSAYVTKIGEQLLTLPQQLEPFLTNNEEVFALALKYCKLPSDSTTALLGDNENVVADHWLNGVANRVMGTFVKGMLNIHHLSESGCKQLCADIGYLCNVLLALDVSPTEDLSNCNQLLSISKDEFAALSARLANLKPEIPAAIAKMRAV